MEIVEIGIKLKRNFNYYDISKKKNSLGVESIKRV